MRYLFVILSSILLLSACYIPGDFDATLEIDKEGRYRFAYYGDVMSRNILRKITNNEFTSTQDFDKAIDIQLRDLTRNGGFKQADYAHDAIFRIDYEHVGLISERDYAFIRRRNEFFSIKKIKNKPKHYKIISHPPPLQQATELEQRGYRIDAQFQVKTNAIIVSHNAKTVTTTSDNAQLLTWPVTSLTAPAIHMEIILD